MSAKRTLLLIRHAETDFAGTFCGHSDPPINERGRVQIERLLTELQHHKPEAVYSSDLQRALTTAKAIADFFAAPLLVTSNLREIGFGDWENSTWERNEQRDSVYAQRWIAEFPRLPAPNGEEFECFEKRTLHEFDTVVASDQNAAIVTHAGVLRLILTRRYGWSEEQAWLQTRGYCGIFIDSSGGVEIG
jgi:broad specificity phosphatase PhoE